MTSHVSRCFIGVLLPFVFLVVLVATDRASANPPPGFYNRWRRDAGEALVIKVTSVRTDGDKEFSLVYAKAEVLAVERSNSKLKSGSTIEIRYEHQGTNSEKSTGPGTPQLLKKGDVIPAFLNKSADKDVYYAAAARESFRMTPEYVPEDE